MDVPVGAEVRCLDGPGGRTTRVLVNPVTKTLTHLVVRPPGWRAAEHLVPLNDVLASSSDAVRLRLTRNELAAAPVFRETEYLPAPDESAAREVFPGYPDATLMLWPYAPFGPPRDAHAAVPAAAAPETLAIRRGAAVEASDHRLGHVDEFLVSPVTGAITHLVLGEGHLWGEKEVTIPVSEVARIDAGTVYLALSKDEVAALPSVRRRG